MTITDEQMQQLLTRLNITATNKVCPMCGQRNWNAEPKIFEIREFHGGNLVVGGDGSAIIPVIPITCVHCGNIQFLNAITSGLMEIIKQSQIQAQNQAQDDSAR